jgi:hypothetical protein
MGFDFDFDDRARLLALEHAFGALALISAGNFAANNNMKTSEAVSHFRDAIEGAVYDSKDYPSDVRDVMYNHLKRMFDNVVKMSKHVDIVK